MLNYLNQLLEDYIKSMSGLKVGEIDIGDQVLDNKYRIKLLFKLLQKMIDKNPSIKGVTLDEFEAIKKEAEAELQADYPNSGIKIT